MNDSLSRQSGLDKEALRLGLREAHDEDMSTAISQSRRALLDYQHRQGIPKIRGFQDDKQLARKHGRDDYWSYVFSHAFVLGSDLSQMFRQRQDKRGDTVEVRVYLKDDDPRFITAVAVFAMRSALLAHRGTAEIFGWEEEAQPVGDLLRKVEALEEELSQGRP